jgi:hypothetical protein
MKKLILLIILLTAGSNFAYSQNLPEEQVPSPVKDKLYAKFKAADVTWEMEDDVYEAQYLENGMNKSIQINSSGEVILIETQIDPVTMPQAIHNYINEVYQGAEISEAEYIETKDANSYKVELLHNGNTIELIFDETGNFLRLDNSGRGEDDDD